MTSFQEISKRFTDCKTIYLLIILMSLGIQAKGAKARDGSIYYSGEKELQLDGDWRFYWKSFLPLNGDTQQKHKIVKIPSTWNGLTWHGQKLPSFGYATYVLTIISNNDYEDLAIELSDFYSQYSLFINGKLIAKNGKTSSQRKGSVLEDKPQTVPMTLKKGDNEVVLYVSNYQHVKGGFYQSITIGDKTKLLNKRESELIVNMLVIGGMLLVGFFFLGFFFFLRWEKMVLYFALFSISFAFWQSHFGLHTFSLIFDAVPWQVTTRMEYLAFYSTWLLLSSFFKELFFKDYSKWVHRVMMVEVLVFSAVSIFTPLHVYSVLLDYFNMTGIVYLLYVLFVIVRAWHKKRKGSVIVMVSFAMLDVGILTTLLMFYRIIEYNPHVSNILFLLAFLTLSFVFAQRFALAYKTIRSLIKVTEEQKNELEKSKEQLITQADRLKDLDKYKSQFFANVSHDFNTPISLIRGRLQQIMADNTGMLSERDISRIELSLNNCDYMIGLSDDLRTIVNLESKTVVLQKEMVPIAHYISAVVDLFSTAAENKQIDLEFNALVSMDMSVEIDPKNFEKVIYNLLSNALKFTPNGGKILVRVLLHGEDLQIEIQDSGIGISEHEHDIVFERFHQSLSDNYASFDGLGMGLSIVKEMVELHKGNVEIDREFTAGAKFVLRFPDIKREYSQDDHHQVITSPYLQLRTKQFSLTDSLQEGTIQFNHQNHEHTLLVVDDNPEMRVYLRDLLSPMYGILEAINGVHALEVAKEHSIDLILLDYMMPSMDGLSFITSFREVSGHATIPVLLLTANAQKKVYKDFLLKGGNDVIHKPFEEDILISKIKNLLHIIASQDSSVISPIGIAKSDDALLKSFRKLILKEISGSNKTASQYASALNLSDRTFFRTVKKLTGNTPLAYVKELKLSYAHELLRLRKVKNTTEAAKFIGYANSTDFAKTFENMFGKSPADVLDNK